MRKTQRSKTRFLFIYLLLLSAISTRHRSSTTDMLSTYRDDECRALMVLGRSLSALSIRANRSYPPTQRATIVHVYFVSRREPNQIALFCLSFCGQGSIGLPDVHSGYGFAIGNVAAFDMSDPDAVVSPGTTNCFIWTAGCLSG